ncbi:hypothetical protein [Catellatospora paridis]|uniref:hypothetical protein n=1 Tax=Catellatospora paridis TaxID=1617086 RepID=UPI0012D41F2D|nr:hypothetical protein [Catellatospora paridis]
MFRHLPFPFEGDTFPHNLGAVIQRTVFDGLEPAREVGHTADNSWFVGDDINDPNLPGAAIAACIWHAINQNSSMAELANLPLGHVARRDHPGSPWIVEPHVWRENDV